MTPEIIKDLIQYARKYVIDVQMQLDNITDQDFAAVELAAAKPGTVGHELSMLADAVESLHNRLRVRCRQIVWESLGPDLEEQK